jgi:hypothetical protein
MCCTGGLSVVRTAVVVRVMLQPVDSATIATRAREHENGPREGHARVMRSHRPVLDTSCLKSGPRHGLAAANTSSMLPSSGALALVLAGERPLSSRSQPPQAARSRSPARRRSRRRPRSPARGESPRYCARASRDARQHRAIPLSPAVCRSVAIVAPYEGTCAGIAVNGHWHQLDRARAGGAASQLAMDGPPL